MKLERFHAAASHTSSETHPTRILALTVRADIGGGPEHIFQLCRNIGDGMEIFIACPDEPPYHDRYAALPNVVEVIDLPHRRFQFGALFRLARIVRERRIDLIHSHGKGAGLYGRLLAALTGRPAAHTFHGLHVGEYGRFRTRAYLGLERLLSRWTERAICVSEGERELILAAGIAAPEKLTVVDNGVVIPEEAPRQPDATTPRIVAVSRYDYQKNAELIVDIAEALRARLGEGFDIEVLGTGESLPAVRAAVEERGLSARVRLSGPSAAPREVFRRADIFLSTSRWEGMPLAVLEAMSEGLAVVATDVVGNNDVIAHDRTGLLYPEGDARAGAEAILALASPERRALLGRMARQEVADRFSVARMCQETRMIYQEILLPSPEAAE
ncbi:glycosyltransferase [Amaricoccus solimangrovi]|uniref:Glycosyltransferase family 4 protein n=1 Tax=Amaricoccus solimangrovi TaxID=2589815 RepID=A0A501WHY1_9RHOB|nr:glycosyltransferase [Amaricoccus solimangrovi]TPE49129.1 glycosyltransferase family 4 protein [Amaricoccus solimangrovi]